MNPHLNSLLSGAYDTAALHPEALADLKKSGLRDETIRAQKILSVSSALIRPLLGFPAPKVVSAYIIPFPDPRGGWFDHVRLKIFPPLKTARGTVKYLQPKGSGVRLYFPLATLPAALHSDEALYLVEGEKKSLAVAQLGLLAIGFCGVEGWHRAGSPGLLGDFQHVRLDGRVIELCVDGDVATNPNVARGARRFADALRARGARPRLVRLPTDGRDKIGIDDYIVSLGRA